MSKPFIFLLISAGALLLIMTTRQTRGERNNNPGNIRDTGAGWQGATGSDGAFVTFDTPEHGIRAIARTLKTYYYDRNIKTIAGMVYRWAPPGENDTEAYIASVAQRVSVGTGGFLSPDQFEAVLPELVAAIIYHENGKQPYTTAQIDAGVAAA